MCLDFRVTNESHLEFCFRGSRKERSYVTEDLLRSVAQAVGIVKARNFIRIVL